MKPSELKATLALHLASSFGSLTVKRIREHFGSAERFWQKPEPIPGVHGDLFERLNTRDWFKAANTELKECADAGIAVLTQWDSGYPSMLKHIHDAPSVLFVRGSLPADDRPCVALVGSRIASHYGLKMAHEIARDLSEAGVCVVSGLAKGVDGAAHEGSLKGGGPTIAVLGSGHLKLYPSEHKKLAERISLNGAVISEYTLKTAGLPQYFPIRNRIIAGLCRGVVVVEAKEKSGALITAGAALSEGREVFALPGNADALRSRGTNALLRDGARMTLSAADILEELKLKPRGAAKKASELKDLSDRERRVLSLFEEDPMHVDELIERTGLETPEALSALSQLEIKGIVKQMPGRHFVRIR